MCSFLLTSWLIANLTHVNHFLRPRGPDHTTHVSLHGFSFVHNLLHMTGERVPQPLTDTDGAVVAIYNGEIYNYQALANPDEHPRSDGDVIIPVYRKHGFVFPRVLDGEFALAVLDFKRNCAVLATDTFATKPLWYSTYKGLHASSYRSGLIRLGIPPAEVRMAEPNLILLLGLGPDKSWVIEQRTAHEFDLRQFKEHTDDFQSAFEVAVRKRVKHAIHPAFVGLSSGYDSGAIHAALVRDGVAHFAYMVYSTENIETVARRIEWAGALVETNLIVLSGQDLVREGERLASSCEPFHYRASRGQDLSVAEDPASSGLSYIFQEVRRRGILVYLSGSGADEIISDYGHQGTKIYPHSNFGGLFPQDLEAVFPWPSFFLGTQRDYLMKEELVAGVHGVEARYPFLDRSVVQEFLWLSEKQKNSRYKAPVHDWLVRSGYPFRPGEKLGFNAAHNVRWEEERSLVVTYNSRAAPLDARVHNTSEQHYRETASAAVLNSTTDYAEESLTMVPGPRAASESQQHIASLGTPHAEPAAEEGTNSDGETDALESDGDEPELLEFVGEGSDSDSDLAGRPAEPADGGSTENSPSGSSGGGGSTDSTSTSLLTAGQLQDWEKRLHVREQHLSEQAAQLQAREEALSSAQRDLEALEARVDATWKHLEGQVANIQEQQRAQAESALRFMALRLIPMKHTAAVPPSRAFFKDPLTAPEEGVLKPLPDLPDLGHPRWSGVEVLTCVSGGRYLSVMDFPVYHIFRASTPLPVHNVCENVEWEGMHMRLRRYLEFLSSAEPGVGPERLFIVSDGMDVIFNDMAEVIDGDPELRGRPAAAAAALLVIRRYEEIAGSGRVGRAVFSSERLCGWGGGHLCSAEEAARYPRAPTDSKFLNAGGYIGPASVLRRIIGEVLEMASQAKTDATLGDLRARTTAEDAAGGETDQYFFKRFFWEHPEEVTLDYHQVIFGNFLEVEQAPCYDGWQPRCAVRPCCTLSDDFKRFHTTFYGNYEVRGCSVWRRGRLPVSWHGNGAGKWLWLISLEELSRACVYVANLTVQQYPEEPIKRLFESFDAARLRS